MLTSLDVQAKSHPHRGTRPGDVDGPPRVFVMLQYFEKISPLVESL